MADPRFYDNRGPFMLSALRGVAQFAIPDGADDTALVHDVAGLAQAGPPHLAFFDNARARADFTETKAGFCLMRAKAAGEAARPGMVALASASVGRSFAVIAKLFYPEHELDIRAQSTNVHPTARVDEGAILAPGVVIGPHAEIGAGTRIGAYSVIGRGVAIGRGCEIGSHVSLGFCYVGDAVLLQPGVVIGASGFGFSSGRDGHLKTPQLGRVIVQDRVEVGANSTIDRGALGDTVIGEGTKIDNLVQIGHNSRMGRHCIMAGQSGLSGSATLGDFVIVGGATAISDHVVIGAGARVAGMSGVAYDLEGGRDYGGIPARPVREWHRETLALAKLTKTKQANEP